MQRCFTNENTVARLVITMTAQTKTSNGPGANDPEITLTIHSINGDYTATFPKQAKVADVIAKAVEHFGFAKSDSFELVLESNRGEPLQPNRTLVSYHLKDGTRLLLTALVSGV